ncbi:hypothetical protein TNCV_2467801 [Trichonephila clavipes]|nr:hypothetical protein TNCV_2467801 [Trichonephila clavipes]
MGRDPLKMCMIIRRNPDQVKLDYQGQTGPYRCSFREMLNRSMAVSQNLKVLKLNLGFTCKLQTSTVTAISSDLKTEQRFEFLILIFTTLVLDVASVAESSRYQIVPGLVTSSSPVTRRVGER